MANSPVMGWQHLALWHGLDQGRIEEVQRSLNAGANPNATRRMGVAFEHPHFRPTDTPLHAVLRRAWTAWHGGAGDVDRAVSALLVAGADPCVLSEGATPLWLLCAQDLPLVSEYTFRQLAQGTLREIDGAGSAGRTALMNTARQGRTGWANILLSLGAQPRLRDEGGWNALWHAAMLEENNYRNKTPLLSEPVEWALLEGQCPAGQTDQTGRTVLMVMPHLPVAPWIARGVNPNHRTPSGESLLWGTLLGLRWVGWCALQQRLQQLFDINEINWAMPGPGQQTLQQWLEALAYPAHAQVLLDEVASLHERAVLAGAAVSERGKAGARRL